MNIKSLQWKAVLYGFLSFILAWVLWAILSSITIGATVKPSESIFYTFSMISGLLPGYIASVISKKHYLVHSALTGTAVAAGILLFWALMGILEQAAMYGVIATPVFLIALSLIGGVVAKLQGKTI